MTLYGQKALRRIQIGIETEHGTPATVCTAQLIGTMSMREAREIKRPSEDNGALTKFVRSYVSKKNAEINWEGDATFEQLLYFLSMGLVGGVTPELAGEGAKDAYSWEFIPSVLASGAPDSFTIKAGDNVQAWAAEYCMATSLALKGAMGEGLGLTAAIFGRQLTPGSFDDLPISAVETILTSMLTVSIGDTMEGVSPVAATVHDIALSIDTGLKPVFLADGSLAFSCESEGPRGMELDMTLWFNTSALAEREKWELQTPRYIRLEALGSEIEEGYSKKLTIDLRAKYTDWAALSEKEGMDLVAVKLSSEADVDNDFEFGVTVVNGVSVLP